MKTKLARIGAIGKRVRRRMAHALSYVASGLGDSRYLPTKILLRSLHGNSSELLPLRYTYRADSEGAVTFKALLAGSDVSFRLHEMSFVQGTCTAGALVLSCDLPALAWGDVLSVNLIESSIFLNGSKLQTTVGRSLATRKYISELQQTIRGQRYSRLCSHYLPFDNKTIGPAYYFGDDYIDYPGQTSAEAGLELIRRYAAHGRLLDIGCALGIFTKTFLDAGLDVYAVDVSEFAIEKAAGLVGTQRARRADLDIDDIPFDGDFDAIWMSDVIEHFASPEAVLSKVSARARKGALLFLHTSNADSLTHRLFGRQWEGYSDYSHYGVDQVTSSSLRTWLERLGWDILHWECGRIWAEGVDPVLIRLKEVFSASPELRVLLEEMELGDAIQVVARNR